MVCGAARDTFMIKLMESSAQWVSKRTNMIHNCTLASYVTQMIPPILWQLFLSPLGFMLVTLFTSLYQWYSWNKIPEHHLTPSHCWFRGSCWMVSWHSFFLAYVSYWSGCPYEPVWFLVQPHQTLQSVWSCSISYRYSMLLWDSHQWYCISWHCRWISGSKAPHQIISKYWQ